MKSGKTAGVLALQGDVTEHLYMLTGLGIKVREIRVPEDLNDICCIIFPGGESITLFNLLKRWNLVDPLRSLIKKGMPVFGTCAGAVLLSKYIDEKEHAVEHSSLAVADVKAVRNAFGRQRYSFEEMLDISGLEKPFRGIFIRAPLLLPLNGKSEILCSVSEGPVFIRQKNIWLSSFHPELTEDTRIHSLFLRKSGIVPDG